MRPITLKEYFWLLRKKLQLKIAVHVADTKQQAFNKQFYVLLDVDNKLRVVSPDDIDYLKRPIRERYFEHGHYVEKKKPDGSVKKKYVKGGVKVRKVYQLPPSTSIATIKKDCFYYTPASLNNKGGLTPEERKKKKADWIKYCKKHKL